MKVSVIIPSWNRQEDLKVALKSIYSQDHKNTEVIVVDNGSTDNSAEMVKRNFPKAKLIENSRNMGVSIAKNQGIATSTGDYLLFCDSDIEMTHKKCITNMLKIMQENKNIGALGGEAYIQPDNQVITKKKMITPNCETSTEIIKSRDYELEECGYVATCNCLVPRHLMLKCKGFDSMISYGGEDKELGIQLKKLGYKSIVDSRCLAYHHISQSTAHRNFYALNKNRIRIAIKNYSIPHILALPILEIISLLNPKKFKDIKSGSVDITKYIKKDIKKQNFTTKVLTIGSKYLWSIIKAYGWNILHLPETVIIRIKKPNYLRRIYGNQQP